MTKASFKQQTKYSQHHFEHCHVEQLKSDEQMQTHEMYLLWHRQQSTQSYMTYNACDQLRRATCSMTWEWIVLQLRLSCNIVQHCVRQHHVHLTQQHCSVLHLSSAPECCVSGCCQPGCHSQQLYTLPSCKACWTHLLDLKKGCCSCWNCSRWPIELWVVQPVVLLQWHQECQMQAWI